MTIWIVNPFDDLPDEAGRPLRYSALCRELAARGHQAIWWSSDFSHRLKTYRAAPPPEVDGYRIVLVHTPAYARNVGLARLRNHRRFARQWEGDARAAVASGALSKPDRILVSLPPLETAGHAFRLRTLWGCVVALDLQDAWPETFVRLLPGPHALRALLGHCAMLPWRHQADRAYRQADRISACAQTYLDLAARRGAHAPMRLACHATTLPRTPAGRACPARFDETHPMRLLYLGAMGRSYDLAAVVRAVAQLNDAGCFIELRLAGEETPHRALRRLAMRLGVLRDASATTGGGVVFLGYLKGESLQAALAEAHSGIIPMVPDARVGIPNKLVDYAAAGLPILSCIGGESERLLDEARAGWSYPCRDADALAALVRRLYDAPATLNKAAHGAHDLAKRRFDGATVSRELADFLELPLT